MKRPVAIIRQGATALFRQMIMPCACVIVVRAGRKQIAFQDGRRLTARPGEVIAISAGDVIDIANICDESEEYRADYIEFEDALLAGRDLRSSATTNGKMDLHEDLAVCVDRVVQAIDAEITPTIVRHRLREILLWLDEAGIQLQANKPNLITSISTIVGSAPERNWTTEAILVVLRENKQAMSEATLRRRLAEDGVRFSSLVTEARMRHALTLIQTSNNSIATIAFECGYHSPSRFAVCFRRRFGIAPSALRSRAHL